MSLSKNIKQVLQENLGVAYRPSQAYLVATGAYTIFSIIGGAVEILTLGARVTAAAVGATEVRITANGINTDAAAVAINGAVGTVVYSCVNVGGTLINAAAVPKTVATLTSMIVGTQPTTAGLIVATFTVGTSFTGEWFCVYRKLSPLARIF